ARRPPGIRAGAPGPRGFRAQGHAEPPPRAGPPRRPNMREALRDASRERPSTPDQRVKKVRAPTGRVLTLLYARASHFRGAIRHRVRFREFTLKTALEIQGDAHVHRPRQESSRLRAPLE